MATYLSRVNFNGSNGGHFYLELYYDILSTDITNNLHTLRYYEYVGSVDGWSSYGTSSSCYINGSWVGSITSIAAYSRTLVGTLDVTINHNADGTGSTGYSASVSTPWSGLGSASLSGNITLPTIPRASSITATDAFVESATSINISRATTSFKHKITYSFEGLTGTVADNVDVSCGWTIPSSFYAKLKTKSSATCTLTCQTYNGSTLIGSKTTTFKVSVNVEKNKPELTAIIIDTNSTTVNLTGSNTTLVRYFSNAKVTMTATAKNEATIKTKSIVCGDGKTLTDSGTINNVESSKFTISATDSRGISNSITETLTIVDYIKLTLKANFYRSQPTNNEVVLDYSGNFFNKTFGSITNTLSLKYRYKEHNSSTWSSYTSLTPTKSGNTYSKGTTAKSLGTNFDYRTEYDFELVVSDKLMTITESQTVSLGKPIFDWGRDDFQFNVPVFLEEGQEILNYDIVDSW